MTSTSRKKTALPTTLADLRRWCAKASSVDLAKAIRSLSEQIETNIERLAVVYQEVRSRGEVVGHIDEDTFGHFLMGVASGRLLPASMLAAPTNPAMLAALSQLSHAAQRQLIVAGHIPVVRSGEGVVNVPLSKITHDDIKRSIDPITGRIIPPAEQKVATAQSPDSKHRRLSLTLTAEEYAAISSRAAAQGRSANALIMEAARNAGLFEAGS